MSAFLVSKANIDAIVLGAFRLRDIHSRRDERYRFHDDHRLREWGPDQVGRTLWQWNLDSVEYRYEPGAFEGFDPEYKAPPLHRGERPDPVVVLKLLDYLEYQACEHPTWRDETAYHLLSGIRRTAIRALRGYDDAPWGLS